MIYIIEFFFLGIIYTFDINYEFYIYKWFYKG